MTLRRCYNNVDNGVPRPVRDVELHMDIKRHHDLHPHSELYSARSKAAPGSEPDAINEDSDTTISDDDDDSGEDVGAAITVKRDGMAFHISQWPAMSDAYQSAFEALKASKKYDVLPIPAYDLDGEPIRPSHYRSQLRSALVELHCNVDCWNFPQVRQAPRQGHRDGKPHSHRWKPAG
ncbi:hypothetical protein AURDEDRAFT_116814 [Auricularia subglabra TFB-10046 SS5]|uniref:Uncharacterized protein n=1 Tax=Auricularia subglabra (strain TFB-10046 / SS5) TaxID=717982 RepID=J0WVS0_AURST|nr:hypothetical protein AURDEDRAFT_116814 [Auricularia subglabra TFB-10046 SS5]